MTGDTTQLNPQAWGIDRIDQRSLPLSASYTYTATGSGVKAYIIDSGIRFTHTQFGGRAISGYDAVDGGTADDCNGHGTHVAGTVGGSSIGVARGVTLVAVRVLGCSNSGATSGVIAGVDWVTGNHVAGEAAVANMSLGGGAYSPLDTAVQNLINDGVTVAVAAGNGNTSGVRQNACNYSPARVTAAITVGATDQNDVAASFSNYGSCVDWLAPGVSILSSWYTSDTAGAYLDGTSQATPHVAGTAALYLQNNPSASPSAVRTALYNLTTKNVISNVGTGTPNALAYTNM
jgi:subtilisin family serine protease